MRANQSRGLAKPLHHRPFPSPMCSSHRPQQTLQLVECPQLRLVQRHKQTTTSSSRRAAKGQSQHHKQLASYSVYKRRVGADLSGSVARVAISVGWGCTRYFAAELCSLRRLMLLTILIAQNTGRHSADTPKQKGDPKAALCVLKLLLKFRTAAQSSTSSWSVCCRRPCQQSHGTRHCSFRLVTCW